MSTLKEQAQIIRDETIPGANTAQRVGDMLVNIVNEVEKKLSKDSLAQGTGSSTSTAMSQDAVSKELGKRKEYEEYTRKALTGQEETATANDYPFVRIDIENSDGSGWNTLNEKLNDINTIATPKYNGWVRYFLSGQAIDVVNRVLFFGNKTTSQVATGPLVISNGKLAYSGDVDKSFARIYKGSSWSPWAPVNSGDPGISSSFYKTPLDLEAVDEGSPLSSSDMEKILLMQAALNEGQTVISSVGVLNASIVYRRPSYIINISYIKGSEMRILSATAPTAGGTWHAQNIDLSTESEGSDVLVHGNYAHGEGFSSQKAYEGSTIPSDVQQVMMDWYMSSTGFAIAYGEASHVEGKNCLATGDGGHAEGIKTLAANNGAHAEGTETNAAGTYAHAEGQSTTAYATACHSEGGLTICRGNYGHVEGFRCTVENTAGHAEGYVTYCRSNYGHAEGRQTNSIGPCAHAEGYGNKIDRSITITGIENIENVSSSFTADDISDLKAGACFVIDNIPYVVKSIKDDKVYLNRWVEFKQQKYDISIMYGAAYGNNSHVEGELGSAIGKNAHVSGESCLAFNDNEFACGKYNESVVSDQASQRTIYSIGIGDGDNNRRNAIEVKENGEVYINGVGGYYGSNAEDGQSVADTIRTASYLKTFTTDIFDGLQNPGGVEKAEMLSRYNMLKTQIALGYKCIAYFVDFKDSKELDVRITKDKADQDIVYIHGTYIGYNDEGPFPVIKCISIRLNVTNGDYDRQISSIEMKQ